MKPEKITGTKCVAWSQKISPFSHSFLFLRGCLLHFINFVTVTECLTKYRKVFVLEYLRKCNEFWLVTWETSRA